MKITDKAAASTGLCALFLVVYPACNWITSFRPHVGSLRFGWEQHLPFVPALIIPYLSIDLFFVAAPFLAGSARELRTLACRIAAAILLAGGCFLLFPLKCSFTRHHVDGLFGIVFTTFQSIDLPFNQCPSLHVALLILFTDPYFRHTRGLLRAAIGIWFALIFVSTVLTYQHQVVDIAGGLLLAVVCFYLFREEQQTKSSTVNLRLAGYYITGAIVLFCLGFVAVPWSYILFWPAVALTIAAVGYVALGSKIYRKERGAIPGSTWLVLWPLLLGQRLSLSYYSRQCQPYDRLTDHLWIGRRLSAAEAHQACVDGVTAVVDLTAELPESKPFLALSYLQLPVLDLTAPQRGQIDQAVEFIQKHAAEGVVYLHCKVGYSRTAVVAAAYLMASGDALSAESAVQLLRRTRSGIIIRPEAIQAIDAFESCRLSSLQTTA